jgi:predicted alpha/beta-hydrolase family hydrolase
MTTPATFDLELLIDGPPQASHTIVLAHGAGAGMDHEFMDAFAQGLADREFRVVRFEFPYMASRRKTQTRRPPDRAPVLRATWLRVIASVDAENLLIGGKSMGGRIASLIADEARVSGLICLGYPFHPSGKPEKLRTDHLQSINTPTLILQGERDALGSQAEVDGYRLSKKIQIHWLSDGDHSFKPRQKSGRTLKQNWSEAIEAIVDFSSSIDAR